VKKGCDILDISIGIIGYSLPSSHLIVPLEGAQDLVIKE
jgi:hypothetical protein